MKKRRKICVITGNRAEYGHLFWVLQHLNKAEEFILQLVVTGMHLSPEFGMTYKQIEKDGFIIDAKVETVMSSDSAVGIAKSIGVGTIGFADAFDRLQPDLVLIDGDRYELLAAVQTALVHKIPVAHIGGGDITESSYDDAIRHAITKMSHLHFPSNEESAQRIRQLGEDPKFIFNVGSPGIDYIKRLKLLDKEALQKQLSFEFYKNNLLITYHPVTLSQKSMYQEFSEVLSALDNLSPDFGLIFTKTNSDNEGRKINEMIDSFVTQHQNSKVYTSLGQELYLSTLAHVDAVVGNSSSGLYEAPSLNTATVNIGSRQKGRPSPNSVVNCICSARAIEQAIYKAMTFDLSTANISNPYGDGESSLRVISTLKKLQNYKSLLVKSFHNIEV